MKIVSVVGEDNYSFEIERFTQGLEIRNIPTTAKIKIDAVRDNLQDSNVFPEMTIANYHTIMQGIDKNYIVGEIVMVEVPYIKSLKFLFARLGVLPLSEKVRYKVTLSGLSNFDVVINSIDNEIVVDNPQFQAIRIEKFLFKDVQSELPMNLKGVTHVYFADNDDVFDKITYLKPFRSGLKKNPVRKVELSKEQFAMKRFSPAVKNIFYLDGDVVEHRVPYSGVVWDVRGLFEVTAHHDSPENLYFFKIING